MHLHDRRHLLERASPREKPVQKEMIFSGSAMPGAPAPWQPDLKKGGKNDL
jgi:hypothetical protein